VMIMTQMTLMISQTTHILFKTRMLCSSKEIYGFQDNNNKINSNILLSKLRI
jgi:hypothetical protein